MRLNLLHLFGREPRNSELVIEAPPIQAVEQRKIRALMATITLPQTSCLSPCPRQNSAIERLPSRAKVAFRLPGL